MAQIPSQACRSLQRPRAAGAAPALTGDRRGQSTPGTAGRTLSSRRTSPGVSMSPATTLFGVTPSHSKRCRVQERERSRQRTHRALVKGPPRAGVPQKRFHGCCNFCPPLPCLDRTFRVLGALQPAVSRFCSTT